MFPKLYYYHGGLVKKNLVKKTNEKDLIKTIGSKSTCPKWHFGQVGHGGFFWLKFLVKKSIFFIVKVLIATKLPILLCYYVLNSLFTDNYHMLGNIGKHFYASWAANTWHPRSYELWFWMRNVHHQLFHAFLVTLWVFSNPQGNISKLGFDLDGIIFLIPKKNMNLLKIVFSFAPDYSEPKKI